MLILALAALPDSVAAEATELPPMFRGDVVLAWQMDNEHTRLLEGDTLVGRRAISEHVLTFGGVFSFAPGAAAFFEMPHYAGTKIAYTEAHEMIFNPTSEGLGEDGTMVGTGVLEPQPEVKGNGLGGSWIGLRAAPFSESYARHDFSTWMIELGYRFKDDANFWTFNQDNVTRGGGSGAPAMRLRMAFSTTKGRVQPYLVTALVNQRVITVDLRDSAQNVLAADAQIDPANSAEVRTGAEIVTYTDDAKGARFATDVFARFGYVSGQEVPSGVYLPSVLPASLAEPSYMGEHATVRGGVGLYYRIVDLAQLNVSGEFGSFTPYRIDHSYPIATGMGALTWDVRAEVKIRGRDTAAMKAKKASSVPEAATEAIEAVE